MSNFVFKTPPPLRHNDFYVSPPSTSNSNISFDFNMSFDSDIPFKFNQKSSEYFDLLTYLIGKPVDIGCEGNEYEKNWYICDYIPFKLDLEHYLEVIKHIENTRWDSLKISVKMLLQLNSEL